MGNRGTLRQMVEGILAHVLLKDLSNAARCKDALCGGRSWSKKGER